jgi:hypothetical protein
LARRLDGKKGKRIVDDREKMRERDCRIPTTRAKQVSKTFPTQSTTSKEGISNRNYTKISGKEMARRTSRKEGKPD